MPTTPRFGLTYPTGSDLPDFHGDLQQLATDADGQLGRALPCTTATRPTGVPIGFLIRDSDVGGYLGWSGTVWETIGASAGGGGGAVDEGWKTFRTTTNQSVPNATDTVLSLGDAEGDLEITRSAKGSGHKFSAPDGVYIVTGTVRYAAAAVTGERYAGLAYDSNDDPITGQGGAPASGLPVTASFAHVVNLAPTRAIYVALYQATGSSRLLERGDGSGWVNLSFARVA